MTPRYRADKYAALRSDFSALQPPVGAHPTIRRVT